MTSPLTRRPESGGAPPQAVPASPARPAVAAEYLLPAGWRGVSAQVAAALGMLTGLWVAISPWFIVLQHGGDNATITDLVAGQSRWAPPRWPARAGSLGCSSAACCWVPG